MLSILKRKFPELKWKAIRNGFGWYYEADNGWVAAWKSSLVSTHPDDMDGHAQSVLYLERPDKPDEAIYHGNIYSI